MDAILNNDWLLLASVLWVLPWKGLSMWRAARKGSKIWFIVLLAVNTFGLLEIIYFFFGEKLTDKYRRWRAVAAGKAADAAKK